MKPLWEKYRPANWANVIGQEKVQKQFETIKGRGIGGRSFWISGKSGQGKTTIAYLIAAEIADPFYTFEIDSSDLTPAKLREIEPDLNAGTLLSSTGKQGRAYIVNESHGLRRDTVRQLLVLLERLPERCIWIFTTTNEGQTTFEGLDDSSPLLSRCVEFRLNDQRLAKQFAQRAKEIAGLEGLDGKPLNIYENLVKKCRNNFRMILSEIEKGVMKERG